MTSTLPPAPPEDDDRERKWIIEGLRQALARATVDELARLTSLLEPEADGSGNVAGWLVMLFADEVARQHLDGVAADAGAGAARELGRASGSGPGAAEDHDEPPASGPGAAEDHDEVPCPGPGVPEDADEVPDPGAGAAEDNGEVPDPGPAAPEDNGESLAPGPGALAGDGEDGESGAGKARENGHSQPADLSGRVPAAGRLKR